MPSISCLVGTREPKQAWQNDDQHRCMTPRGCRGKADSGSHLALELLGQGGVVQCIRELRLQRLERHRVVALRAARRPSALGISHFAAGRVHGRADTCRTCDLQKASCAPVCRGTARRCGTSAAGRRRPGSRRSRRPGSCKQNQVHVSIHAVVRIGCFCVSGRPEQGHCCLQTWVKSGVMW